MSREWMGETTCQICHKQEPKYIVDGKTVRGPWATMCGACHVRYGVGLGIGKGQKYVRQTDGSYIQPVTKKVSTL